MAEPLNDLQDASRLEDTLSQIDGRGYGEYKRIRGGYRFDTHTLRIDRTQRDPFAPPTLVRCSVPLEVAGFPDRDVENRSRSIALCDYVTRRLARLIADLPTTRQGSGNSGKIEVAKPGQEIVERTSVQIIADRLEARIYVGLPASGRRILGGAATRMLLQDLTDVVMRGVLSHHLDAADLKRHLDVNEDQDALRGLLAGAGLVCFVGEDAVLPRASGVSDRPMDSRRLVAFKSPVSLAVEMTLPNAGLVRGMGIPRGVTLITGGGYHGKSTLLRAIERGIYNHIPGDGREQVVTVGDAIKCRSEEGRAIRKVDLRPLIDRLPFDLDAAEFTSEDASGSTSQAAGIIEAIEAGASALLMDEDSSASNFLCRDNGMAQLVPEHHEPIRAYDRFVRSIAKAGVSTIMAVGGTSAYLGKADHVLRMTEYVTEDVTDAARKIAEDLGVTTEDEPFDLEKVRRARVPVLDDDQDRRRMRVRSDRLDVGSERIDVERLEQLCAPGQVEGLGHAVLRCLELIDGHRTLVDIVDEVAGWIGAHGLDAVLERPSGRAARPRRLEIWAAMNRLRGLWMR